MIKPPHQLDDFLHLCRCTKQQVVALAWSGLKLLAYGVNHGIDEELEPCKCIAGIRTPNCTHAEDMIFNVKDPEIYKGCVLEINWFPCGYRCSDNIIKHGIKTVCWTDGKHFEAIEKIQDAGIECFYGTYTQYLNREGREQCKKF